MVGPDYKKTRKDGSGRLVHHNHLSPSLPEPQNHPNWNHQNQAGKNQPDVLQDL